MSTGSSVRVSKRVEKELHQTKVVIRRLPPDFTTEKFLETVQPLPSNSYFYFAPGDPSLGPHGCCTAYIAFTNESEIVPFRDKYDGLILESEKRVKYRMTVEYAPFQNTPKKTRKKSDPRVGTIEQDADFIAFLEAYEATEEPVLSLDLVAYLQNLEVTKPKQIQSTPLTEYLDKKGLRKKGRSEAKKKHKGESGKGKGSKDASKPSKSSEQSSRETRRKDRKQQDKSIESPRRLSTNVDDEPTQWPTIEPVDVKNPGRDSKPETSSTERHSKGKGEGRSRNKDRPDKAIYAPRNHHGDDASRHKEEAGGDRGQIHRHTYKGGKEDEPREKYSGRSRGPGRGPRDRQKEYSDYKH